MTQIWLAGTGVSIPFEVDVWANQCTCECQSLLSFTSENQGREATGERQISDKQLAVLTASDQLLMKPLLGVFPRYLIAGSWNFTYNHPGSAEHVFFFFFSAKFKKLEKYFFRIFL